MTTPSERQERVKEMRPANCRFRLQDEGKPYPKSMCTACGATITTGLGKQCTRTESPTPAEPNPPGSGEPVGWQWREKDSDGNWSEWQIGSANTNIWYRRAKGNYELRNLYAAPLPSPSEGAALRIKELERQNGWLDARLHDREADLATERQRREEAEALALPLSEAWASHGSTERIRLDALRGCLDAWHFSDAAKHFANYEPRTRTTATGGGDNG